MKEIREQEWVYRELKKDVARLKNEINVKDMIYEKSSKNASEKVKIEGELNK